MNWLLQQPLVIIVAGAVVELVLFGILHQTGRKWVVYAMAAAAVLFAGLLALERMVVTPEEAVRATLYAIARDAQNNDADAVAGRISARAPELQSQTRRMLEPFRLEEVKIKKISDLSVRPDHRPATASVRVRVLAVGGDRHGAIQHQRMLREFDVDFVLEDEAWRVRGYEDLGTDYLRP